jgi:hypothetical protein
VVLALALPFFFALFFELLNFAWVALIPPLAYAGLQLWKERRHENLPFGSDGLLISGVFMPWSDVMMIMHDTDGVSLLQERGPTVVLDVLDVQGVERAASEALAAYRAADVPDIDALRVRVETTEERAARLAQLRAGTGYRGANTDESIWTCSRPCCEAPQPTSAGGRASSSPLGPISPGARRSRGGVDARSGVCARRRVRKRIGALTKLDA